MKSTFTLLFILLCLNSFAQWNSLNGPAGAAPCLGVYTNESFTLAGIGNNLWRSTDDGDSWEMISEGLDSNVDPRCFVEVNGVIAMGTNNGERVYRSTDGGLSWEPANSGMPTISGFPAAVPTKAIAFNDVMYMCGTNFFRKSTDLGLTWESMDQDGLSYGLGVSDDAVWYTNSGGLFASTDDGATWEQKTSPSFMGLVTASPTSVREINDRIICTSDLSSGAGSWVSDDNGDTWTSTGISIGSDVEVYNNVAYATAYNGLFKSTDNGDSWELIGSGSNAASISRNSEYLWYASGNGVFRLGLSDDSILSSALPVSTVSTAYVSSTHLYALSDGELFNATLGTENWQNLTSNITADEGTVEQFYVDGDDLYVWFGNFPDYTLYQSSNQGQSFQALNTPDISGQWNGVFSFNPVILSGQNDLAELVIHYSLDDGSTWQEATINSDVSLSGASITKFTKAGDTIFGGGLTGYAFSTDNGQTWQWEQNQATQVNTVLGWNGKWIRFFEQNNFFKKVEISTDNGDTWTEFYDGIDGFPNSFGPSGIWFSNNTIYTQNHPSNGSVPGGIYQLTETAAEWVLVEGLEPINATVTNIISEDDAYFVAVPQNGIWTSGSTGTPDNVSEEAGLAFAMGPNPANNVISVFNHEFIVKELQVIDLHGKMLIRETESTSVELHDLPSGVYMLRVLTENDELVNKRFLKTEN